MTNLTIHANEIPTFEFVNHGDFQVLRIYVVTSENGDRTLLTVHLPEGSSHDDITRAIFNAKIEDTRSKQEAMV
ncbi:MAG: hypothetical protein EBX09_06470 [Actinobacteria bacterium]|nr:hypothetical protein [Actinomycetota bacterium]